MDLKASIIGSKLEEQARELSASGKFDTVSLREDDFWAFVDYLMYHYKICLAEGDSATLLGSLEVHHEDYPVPILPNNPLFRKIRSF